MTDYWLILKCLSAATLPLAKSLAEAGYEVWTPIEVQTRRVVRANIKRRISVPLAPGYLFAAADRLLDLYALHDDPTHRHRAFRIMCRPDLGAVLIADATLEPLRQAVRRRQPLVERCIHKGDRVRLTGAFQGLFGIVETVHRKQFAMVQVPGFQVPLEIAAWQMLLPKDESDQQREAA